MFKSRRSSGKVVTWIVVSFLTAVIVIACSSADDGTKPTESSPAAVEKAREALADELGVEVEEVAIESFEEVEWSDSCLGLGGPAESCLAAIHPGWQVMLSIDGELGTLELRGRRRLLHPGVRDL